MRTVKDYLKLQEELPLKDSCFGKVDIDMFDTNAFSREDIIAFTKAYVEYISESANNDIQGHIEWLRSEKTNECIDCSCHQDYHCKGYVRALDDLIKMIEDGIK